MPSTISSSVSSDFASSTVITPSLPTFCIAPASIRPISWSPLAEIVPTCAISSFVEILRERLLTSSTAVFTPRSMPRFRSIGFMPAATALAPSRTIAWASTVAVVVPSPAVSLVLDATSRTIWAPMFSNLSESSISLATVTPSLLIRGAPKLLSSTTLRPFGPSVTLTALASVSTPRNILSRASLPKRTSFAAISPFLRQAVRDVADPPFSSTPRMSDSFMISRVSPLTRTSVPDHLPKSTRSPTLTSSGWTLPVSSRAPCPTATTSPSIGFSLAVSGMMIPPAVFSSASTRLIRTRSCKGLKLAMPASPSLGLGCRMSAARRRSDRADTSGRADAELVPDHRDAGRRPRRPFGLLPFRPGADGAGQDDLAPLRFDRDAAGVEFGAAPECVFDLPLDLLRRDLGLDLDQVADALDALQRAHRFLGRFPLIVPFDRPFQRDPAFLDDDLDVLPRERQIALEHRDGVARDLRIGPFVDAGQSDLDVVRHADDPGNPFGGLLSLEFVAVIADEPGQRNDTVLHRDRDVGCIEPRCPSEFRFHIALDLAVGLHGPSPRICAVACQ